MVGAANYGNASIIMAEGRALRDRIQAAVAVGYRGEQDRVPGPNF